MPKPQLPQVAQAEPGQRKGITKCTRNDPRLTQERAQRDPNVNPEVAKVTQGREQRRCSRRCREQRGLLTQGVANGSPPIAHPNNVFRCFRLVCSYDQTS